MYKKIIASLYLFLACSFSANAALITIESADANFGNNSNVDLSAYWAGLSDNDIATVSFADATMLFSGSAHNYSIYKMTINLFPGNDLRFSLFAGLDAGNGAELFQNGTLVSDINTGVWWRKDWNDSNVISANDLMLDAGSNQLTFLWAENTNSGGNSFEFAIGDGPRQALSSANVRAQVPAPSTLGLFALTLIGLSLYGRRKS